MSAEALLEKLVRFGLEAFRKYYGTYRGVVLDNRDPEKRGRILVSVSAVGHPENQGPARWVDPVFAGAAKKMGTFWPPEIKDTVWVSFAYGDPSQPQHYYGGWFGKDEVPDKLGYNADKEPIPMRRGFRTKAGHTLVLNDEPGKESIELYWKDESTFLKINEKQIVTVQTKASYLLLDPEAKKVEVKDEKGSTITLDDKGVTVKSSKDINMEGKKVTIKGSEILLDSSKVTLDTGGAQGVPKGQDLLTWLNAHLHPTGVGPSGPPAAPASPALLSTKVKVI